MIKRNNIKYYTTYEIVDLINDPRSELYSIWRKFYPKCEKVILLEQVNRIVFTAKKLKKISFIEFTRGVNGKKKYYAFPVDDLIKYIEQYHASNIKLIDKE